MPLLLKGDTMEKIYIIKVKYEKDHIKNTSYVKAPNLRELTRRLEAFKSKKIKEGYTIKEVMEHESYDI